MEWNQFRKHPAENIPVPVGTSLKSILLRIPASWNQFKKHPAKNINASWNQFRKHPAKNIPASWNQFRKHSTENIPASWNQFKKHPAENIRRTPMLPRNCTKHPRNPRRSRNCNYKHGVHLIIEIMMGLYT